MNWLYRFIPLRDDFITNDYGFIYKITNLKTNKFYIGKKAFFHNKKKKLTKKELAEQTGPGRKKTKEVTYAESDWKTYWGSCKPLLEDVALIGEDKFYREILELAWNSKHLSYLEAKYQFVLGCLEKDSYNDNIQGRYFKKDLAFNS